MKDPERLLDGGATDFERQLLAGGAAEQPSTALSQKMAVGIGVGGALGFAAQAKAAVATFWGKAVLGTVLGAAVATSVALSGGEPPAAAEVEEPSVAAPVAAQPAAPAEPKAVPLEEATEAEPTEQAPAKASHAVVKAPSEKKSTLAEEIKLIDRARALVQRGKSAEALRVLDTYSRKYPSGVLQHEAGVLRARANEPGNR
jgi:hypothetical protein